MRSRQTASRIIAIAGAKGGIGRSTFAVTLGRALAALDRRVLLVDENGFAGGLATLVDLPPQSLQDIADFTATPTSLKNLDFVAVQSDEAVETQFVRWRKSDYDDIILDLRAGFGSDAFDCFLNADLPLLLADSESASIQIATLWLRHICIRYLDQHLPECASYLVPQDSWTFDAVYASVPPALQVRFVRTLESFRCGFLLNSRRENSEILQSEALCHAWGMMLGVNVDFAGSLHFDERRWFFARRLADVSLFQREDPLVRECDEIARTRFDCLFKPQHCLPLLNVYNQPRQFLRVETPDAARQAYRKLWEGYRRENGLVSQVLPPDVIARTIKLLEAAHMRADLEPEPAPVAHHTHSGEYAQRRAHSGEYAQPQAFTADACAADAGSWLQKLRENAGLTRPQLALKSRIPQKVIEHLEQRDLTGLTPSRLQAYLVEIARILGIDADEVRHKFGF